MYSYIHQLMRNRPKLVPGYSSLLLLAGMTLSTICVNLPAATGNDAWSSEARQTITHISEALEKYNPQSDEPRVLGGWISALSALRVQAQKCVDERTENLDKLKKSITEAQSQQKTTAESAEVNDAEFRKRFAVFEEQLQVCRIILIDAGITIEQIKEIQTKMLKTHLFNRGSNIWEITVINLQQADSLLPLVKSLFLDRLQLGRMHGSQWVLVALLAVMAGLFGIWWRRRILQRLMQVQGDGYTVALLTSLRSCIAAKLPLLLPIATSLASLLHILPNKHLAPSVAVLVALLVFIAGSVIIRVFLNPCPPACHFLKADPAYCRSLGKYLYGLLLLILVAVLFIGLGVREIQSQDQWHMTRAVFLSVAVFILLWLIVAMQKAPAPFDSRKLRGLLMLVLLVSIGAELTGYRNLSIYLLGGLVGTILLGSMLWVANVLLLELFDGLDEGRFAWGRNLRYALHLGPEEPVPGLIWLRLLMTLIIWLVFIAGLIVLWGYNESVWTMLKEIFAGGFNVAGMQVVPVNLVIAIAVFALLVTLVRWIRNDILPGWVERTGVSRGAKEATITISGYVGIIIAALIGLSMAGFNFTNLAIVVGALSVGIGFGLQNIVNNFISGIILLFERPIRTGDWIVVGNTEGYVRKISIRSTQLETFDRADVIVPNSELISTQVTNWMLRDPMGRVIVPIGVAYGTDVERLRELLLQIASEHPLVVQDGAKVSPPKVLFRGFGDSSLDFELRAFIREVDRRLDTLSEMNFAIERRLREAGIQIPFPQRDLHLRSADPSIDFGSRPHD